MKALVHGRAVTVTPPVGQPFLVVEVTISCDVCGDHTAMVAGHHLRPLVSLLQEFIDQHDAALTADGYTETIARREQKIIPEYN